MLEHGGRLREAAAHYQISLENWLDLSTGINPETWPVPTLSMDCWHRLPEADDGLEAAARDAGVAFTTQRVGGMFGLFFTNETVDTFAQAMACDSAAFNRFFHAMLERGVYLAPSAYEAGFMSSAHDEEAIAATGQAAREAFASL